MELKSSELSARLTLTTDIYIQKLVQQVHKTSIAASMST